MGNTLRIEVLWLINDLRTRFDIFRGITLQLAMWL